VADVATLAEMITARLADGVDGVVITQGTDTIEETSYLPDIGHAGAAPIVVTGAIRNPMLAGPDGPANLLAVIQVAASPAAAGLGALVVFGAGHVPAALIEPLTDLAQRVPVVLASSPAEP
jgi:L-asparaginase